MANANFYADSTIGTSGNNGTSFATPKDTIGNAIALSATGDNIWVGSTSAEDIAAVITWTLPGTALLPTRIMSVPNTTSPPAAGSATPGAKVISNSNIFIIGSGYIYGLTIQPGKGNAVSAGLTAGTGANGQLIFDNCVFWPLTTGTGLMKTILGDENRTDSERTECWNSTFRIPGVNHRIKFGASTRIVGGGFVSGGAIPVNLFETGLRGQDEIEVVGLDMSANIGSAFNLIIQPSGGNGVKPKFRNCKFPTSWSGEIWSAVPTSPCIDAEISDSLIGTTKLRYYRSGYEGKVRDNTTIVRTGGATDDGVAFSMQMVGNANLSYPVMPLRGRPCSFYVDSAGSPITVNLEVVHDSQGSGSGAALTNAEMAAFVFGPQGVTTNAKANFLAAPADHAASSATWTTTGMTTPVKQFLAVTFTPPRKGIYTLVPELYVNKTVYYCAKVA